MHKGRNPSPPGNHEDFHGIWSSLNGQNKILEDALIHIKAFKRNIASGQNLASLDFIKEAIKKSLIVKVETREDVDEEAVSTEKSYEDSEKKSQHNQILNEINPLRMPENFEALISEENRDDNLEAAFLGSKVYETEETPLDPNYPPRISGRRLEISSDDSSRSKIKGRRDSTHLKKSHKAKKKKRSINGSSRRERTYDDELEEYRRQSLKSKSYKVPRRSRYSSESSNSSEYSDKYRSHRKDRRSRSRDRASRRKHRNSSYSSDNSSDYSIKNRSQRRGRRRKSKDSLPRSRSRDRVSRKKYRDCSCSSDNSSNYSSRNRSGRRDERCKSKESVTQSTSVTVKSEVLSDSPSNSNTSSLAIPKSLQDTISEDIRGLCVKCDSNDTQPAKASEPAKGQIQEEERSNYSSADEDFSSYGNFLTSGSFYCKVCQKHLNGEACYETHMKGKKHKKAEEKAHLRSEAPSSNKPVENSSKEPVVKQELLTPVATKKRAKYQDIIDQYDDTSKPIPGLDFIHEINNTDGSISYYCNLCDAQCVQTSIYAHLIGFKHYMKFIKIIDPVFYEKNSYKSKKEIIEKVKTKLRDYELKFGRQLIQVKDMKEPEPGSSADPNRLSPIEDNRVNPNDYLDPSGNYICQTCKCTMNNENMLLSHINGKRHLKNVKKSSAGQIPSMPCPSTKKEKDPYASSRLERNLDNWVAEMKRENVFENLHETSIVGLDHIRETQNKNGEIYNCFVCNFCCSMEIIEHITSMKHRTNYLESVKGRIPNTIESIKELELNDDARMLLILEECGRIEAKFGRGKVEVYR